jgi:hypothetical protein
MSSSVKRSPYAIFDALAMMAMEEKCKSVEPPSNPLRVCQETKGTTTHSELPTPPPPSVPSRRQNQGLGSLNELQTRDRIFKSKDKRTSIFTFKMLKVKEFLKAWNRRGK